jgi:hypothetical protein
MTSAARTDDQHRTLRLHDRYRRIVLRREHRRTVVLTLEFPADQLVDLGIEVDERRIWQMRWRDNVHVVSPQVG